MRHRTTTLFTAITATLLAANAAHGHAGHGYAGGLEHGFAHPITGLDHILAMIAVGLLAVQVGGRALWALPLAFVSAMIVGGALGVAGVSMLPGAGVEHAIVASVLILGGLIAWAKPMPLSAVVPVVALAALFHGHAHGTEMPSTASAITYAAGFTLATALLHATGIACGLALLRVRNAPHAAPARTAIRFAGVAIALSGFYLWLA